MVIIKKNILINLISIFSVFIILINLSLIFTSCKDKKEYNLKLFNTESKYLEDIDLESYIEGVVAGEISNNAPLEALKAQAILARTFTLNFLETNNSKYEGADISTDIQEAQAYNKENINSKIKQAVKETKGEVIKYNNEYISSFFHSNSGGFTAEPNEGLNILNEKYPYIKSVKTSENSSNTNNYKWSATFEKNDILKTLRNMGVSITNISSFKKGEIGKSGRCLTFIIGGKEVNSNTFRINIGSSKFKSTFIDTITVNNNSVSFSGKGYGHGVGLSQEYSIVLANEGKNYKDIINYFYKDVEITQI